MSSNPTSFRYPPNIEGKADPQVVQTIQDHDDAINDLQQAIPVLKSQITALQKTGTSVSSSSTSTTSSSSSTTSVTPAQASAIATQAIQSTLGITNNQTGTSYTPLNSDYGSIITLDNASAVAVSLDANGTGIGAQWWAFIQNNGAGTATLTPASGTINGAASITLVTGQSAAIFFDGTNWWAATSTTGGGSGLPTNNPTFTGTMTGPHYASNGATPSVVVHAAAGAGASAIINGNDTAGGITLTTGTGVSSGSLLTVTFTSSYPTGTFVFISQAGPATFYGFYTTTTAATFDLIAAVLLADTTSYPIQYIVSGF